MKISDIKEFLVGYRNDANVIFDRKNIVGVTSLSNGNMYLSSTRKIGSCKTCGFAAYGLDNYSGGEYVAYCPECDKVKTEFEIKKQ